METNTPKPVIIDSLEIHNVKRIESVKLQLGENGLFVIGGENRQGKTSILDAIKMTLGGKEFELDEPRKRDANGKASSSIVLSNGITARVHWTDAGNRVLTVSDPKGVVPKGQTVLDAFISMFALEISKFMNMGDKEKTNTLMKLVGVDTGPIEAEYKKLYDERTAVGRVMDYEKAKAAGITPVEIPADEGDTVALSAKLEELLSRTRKVDEAKWTVTQQDVVCTQNVAKSKDIKAKIADRNNRINALLEEVAQLNKGNEAAEAELVALRAKHATDTKKRDELIAAVQALTPADPAEIAAVKQQIADVGKWAQARQNNKMHEDALAASAKEKEKYDGMTAQLEALVAKKKEMLDKANMPIKGLSTKAGMIYFKDTPWSNMSDADRLIVAAAISHAINPSMGFVLIDRVESMDKKTLKAFGEWLEWKGLQAICTRVSEGTECDIIIEDGKVKGPEPVAPPPQATEAQDDGEPGI